MPNSNDRSGSVHSATIHKRTWTPPEDAGKVQQQQQQQQSHRVADSLGITTSQTGGLPSHSSADHRRFAITKKTGVLCVLLLSAIVGLLAAVSYFNAQPDAPGCAMTYSRPLYIEQTEFSRSWTRYSIKYKLYLYRDGSHDIHDEPNRIPVLFVPGNAGSHKQVRSMASASASAYAELLRRDPGAAAATRGQIGYDFFTVGLNEEFTALHGYSILEQAEFVNDAIRYILSLYPRTRALHKQSDRDAEFALPTSVVVVGHSMGGVVARTALTLPNYVDDSIQALFTLSTPHNNPTASLEQQVDSTYANVNAFWRAGFRSGALGHVSLVSIAGGNLDSMINSDYTYVGDLAPPSNSLSIMSTSINDVWLSLDHQNILWCAQMVKKFATLMVSIMDARQPSQLMPLEPRMRLMRRALYSGIEPNGFVESDLALSPKNSLSSDYHYVHLYESGAIKLSVADMLGLIPKSSNNMLKPKALHLLPSTDAGSSAKVLQVLYDPSLFDSTRCSQHKRSIDGAEFVCEQIAEPVPAKLPLKRADHNPKMPVHSLRYLEVPLHGLNRYSHVGFEMHSRPGKSGFFDAAFVDTPRQITKDPGYLQLLTPYDIRTRTGDEGFGLRSRIRLAVPENPLFVFRAQVTMHSNTEPSQPPSSRPRFGPVALQSDARHYESRFWYDQDCFDIAIHGRGSYLQPDGLAATSRDSSRFAGTWDGLYIDLFVDTDYYSGFDLSLRIDWYSSLNRMVKRHDMALLAVSFIWACLVLAHQLHTWNNQMQMRFGSRATAGAASALAARFPSCLATIERLIRNGTLIAMLVVAALAPMFQELVSHAMQTAWSPATLASWKNLFMGVRGAGWTLCLAPVLLVMVSLGFIIVQAVALSIVCELASWIVVAASRLLGEGNPIAIAAEADVLGTAKDKDRSGEQPLVNTHIRPVVITVVFVFMVSAFLPYQFAFLVIYLAQTITTVRTMAYSRIVGSGAAKKLRADRAPLVDNSDEQHQRQETRHDTKQTAAAILKDRSSYQLALLLFWTSSLPYCVPELLVWVRNISVMWFEDAPSDHNLASMAGYFALRMLATYHIVPRLGTVSEHRSSPLGRRIVRGLRVATFAIFGCSVVYAWLFSIRRPYTLYNIGNIISAWLAIVQFTNYPLRLVSASHKLLTSSQQPVEPRRTQSAEELHSLTWTGQDARKTTTNTQPAALSTASDDYLERKLR
ncbi:GPI inositol deacylase [Coemansia sp. RSA 1933]|nr:GPI inositol deacylase [Coemansia sp. RSA 1933]